MLSLLVVACTSGPSPEDELWEASKSIQFASQAALGPHHLQATVIEQWPAGNGRDDRHTLELSWGDWDHFELQRVRDGKVVQHVLVVDGTAWTDKGGGWRRRDDAELYRGELAQSWDLLSPFLNDYADHFVLEPLGDTVVEGRPAVRYGVRFQAPEVEEEPEQEHGKARRKKRKKRRYRPTALAGEVVLDGASAVRLQVSIEGVVETGGTELRSRTDQVRIVRSSFGTMPVLEPPE